MSEILREIKEDLRAERMENLWKNFGKYIIGACVAVVLFTTMSVAWKHYQHGRDTKTTTRYIAALELLGDKKYAESIALFDEIIKENHADFREFALLKKAQAQQAANKNDAAQTTLKELVEEDSVAGDLAALNLADTAGATAEKDSPIYFSLAEQQGWKLLQAGKKQEALASFNALANALDAPETLRNRAKDVVGQLSLTQTKE